MGRLTRWLRRHKQLSDPQLWMEAAGSIAWAYWVLFLALGGFAGNFVFSLTDHATNGFFHPVEWLPVISSAFAVSFYSYPFSCTLVADSLTSAR